MRTNQVERRTAERQLAFEVASGIAAVAGILMNTVRRLFAAQRYARSAKR
jgi:hypothetical protein